MSNLENQTKQAAQTAAGQARVEARSFIATHPFAAIGIAFGVAIALVVVAHFAL